jgi:apolipoprotein N-acyltransferase
VHYVFRAVEFRVPVVRSVNTGISASIDSDGRITGVVEQTKDGDVSKTMVNGTLQTQVLVDSRVTLYSKTGDLFAVIVLISTISLLMTLWFASRRQKILDEDNKNRDTSKKNG